MELEQAIRRLIKDPKLAAKLAQAGYELAQSMSFTHYLDRITQAMIGLKEIVKE